MSHPRPVSSHPRSLPSHHHLPPKTKTMADWPKSLKPIGKFMARAREVESSAPLVAYYCNFYSLRRALELRDKSDESANRFVTGLLEKCEAAKANIGPDDGTHRGLVEEFALSIFDRADAEDRADQATKSTALTFYAAMCFLEVCSFFGPLTSDLEERLRYAKWKAADITKALREGRRPVPGAPGEAEALEKAQAPPPTAGPSTNPASDKPAADIPPAPPVTEYDTEQSDNPKSSVDKLYPPPLPYPSQEAPSPLQPAKPVATPPIPTLDIGAPPRGAAPAPNPPALFIPPGPARPLYPNHPPVDPAPEPYQAAKHTPTPSQPPAHVQSPTSHGPPATQGMYDPTPGSAAYNGKPQTVSYPPPEPAPYKPAPAPAPYNPAPAPTSYNPAPAPTPYNPAPAPYNPGQAGQYAAKEAPAPAPVQAAVRNPNYKPSVKQTQAAQRLAKYAASALDFQDHDTAVNNLEQALKLLRG